MLDPALICNPSTRRLPLGSGVSGQPTQPPGQRGLMLFRHAGAPPGAVVG